MKQIMPLKGEYLDQYAAVIENDDAFVMPVLDKEFSSDTVLAMSFVDGIPIEQLVDAPQETRDQVMSQLMRLFFKELFDFQLVQTDPNFANYQYDQDTQKVVLIRFWRDPRLHTTDGRRLSSADAKREST